MFQKDISKSFLIEVKGKWLKVKVLREMLQNFNLLCYPFSNSFFK